MQASSSRSLTVIAALVAAAVPLGAARSADMPLKAPSLPPPPVATWTGCYLGVEAGYGWTKVTDSVSYLPPVAFGVDEPYAQSASPKGAMGGAQVGCDYQWGSQWVVGVISTYDFSAMSSSNTSLNPLAPPFGGTHVFNEDIDGFGTVRGRIGWLFAPNWLVYGSGGLAYGRIVTSGTQWFAPTNIYTYPGTATWKTGWTAGGGVEWKFSPHVSLFAEYLYAELGSVSGIEHTFDAAVAADTVADSYSKPKINVFKAGINWRFF